MAHKKGEGKVKNGRESESKRLGIKVFGGQKVIAGNTIIFKTFYFIDLYFILIKLKY